MRLVGIYIIIMNKIDVFLVMQGSLLVSLGKLEIPDKKEEIMPYECVYMCQVQGHGSFNLRIAGAGPWHV